MEEYWVVVRVADEETGRKVAEQIRRSIDVPEAVFVVKVRQISKCLELQSKEI